mmetsp:Transcript_29218/g.68436  ORF Transcript_29218/g.68436 Transcript_29218/m.68436 type:complete len:220 (+) Transcript_29218:3303-3962(+)
MIKEGFNNGRLPLLRLNCDGMAQGKSLLGIFDKHLTSPCLDGRQAPTKSDCVRSTLHSPPTNRRQVHRSPPMSIEGIGIRPGGICYTHHCRQALLIQTFRRKVTWRLQVSRSRQRGIGTGIDEDSQRRRQAAGAGVHQSGQSKLVTFVQDSRHFLLAESSIFAVIALTFAGICRRGQGNLNSSAQQIDIAVHDVRVESTTDDHVLPSLIGLESLPFVIM